MTTPPPAGTPVTASITLIEDDIRLSELIGRYLENNGFRVRGVTHGNDAVEQVRSTHPDLVILDLGLPGKDGFEILRQLRPQFVNPILILTARSDDIDHVLGLERGADDYVIKPVEPRVLLARINALLRRRLREWAPQPTLKFGALLINPGARSVSLDGRGIPVSSNEFDLLVHLASHAGHTQSRTTLFHALYGRDYDGVDRILDVRISQLRKKLGETDSSERIKTVWGHGYLFVPDAW
ncbi:MAG: response regulator transcription factor [Steroidobacteraceae bacterium]|jgi:two-component system OmpR family response regulator/two-component system response regulator RstA